MGVMQEYSRVCRRNERDKNVEKVYGYEWMDAWKMT